MFFYNKISVKFPFISFLMLFFFKSKLRSVIKRPTDSTTSTTSEQTSTTSGQRSTSNGQTNEQASATSGETSTTSG